MTLNLNGGASHSTTPKVCNMPSMIPLIPTPIEKNTNINNNKNESVTVTHFSDLHGGVVEKISVPVTSGSTIENGQSSPPRNEASKTTTSTTISNNPFVDDMLATTIITTSTATSPTIKISTNPFRSSFNTNDKIDSNDHKSVKISFPIVAKNPFKSNDNGNGIGTDDVDNNEMKNSSKIDNNENNVTTIQMATTNEQTNGFKEPAKKVNRFVFHRMH